MSIYQIYDALGIFFIGGDGGSGGGERYSKIPGEIKAYVSK